MIADLILAFVLSWFLLLSTLCLNLLYRAILTSNPYKAAPMAVALTYLGFIALTAQDCFFPGRTPGMFKITSMGPDRVVNLKEEEASEKKGESERGTMPRVEEKERTRVLHLHPVLME